MIRIEDALAMADNVDTSTPEGQAIRVLAIYYKQSRAIATELQQKLNYVQGSDLQGQ